MSMKIKIGENNINKLNSYIKNVDIYDEVDISECWEKYSKHSVFSLDNENVILSKNLFDPAHRLGCDNQFLIHHGFKKPANYRSILQSINKTSRDLFSLFFRNSTHKEIKAYKRIWDPVNDAIHTDEMVKENKFLTWEIIKAYNYYNELSPIVNLIDNPAYYIEIGPGGCHLARIFKSHYNKKLKYVLVDLKSTIPFGFINLVKNFPGANIILPDEITSPEQIKSLDFDFLFLTNEQIQLLPNDTFDIAVNTDSFMEMLPDTINNYFIMLRRVIKDNNVFFCHNRAEKIMSRPGDNNQKNMYNLSNPNVKSNSIPIRFSDYPWDENDEDYFFYVHKFTEARFKHSFFTRATKLAKFK